MNKEQLLLKEIEIVQSEIARFDGNGLTVKEWCVGVWAGLIAYGFAHTTPLIIWAAVVTTAAFGFVEFTYRRFQLRFIDRSKAIESLLAQGDIKDYSYRVHRTAVGDRGFINEGIFVLTMPHFTGFYAVLLILAAVAAILCGGLTA